ncbi:MAG: Smr/MutS family protein [Dehalococcoidia bacterium]|nr:Smr/MutS family protein [Dehalococcoidia bacterium]
MADLPSVHIVHGKETGKLHRTVHESPVGNPLVKSYRPGDYGEGGYGVTIVEPINH